MEPKKQSRKALIWELSRGSRLLYLAAFLSMVVVILTGYLTPQIVRFTIDSVIGNEPIAVSFFVPAVEYFGGTDALLGRIWLIGIAVVLVSLIGGLCNFIRGRTLSMGAEGLIKRLRDRLYDHVQHMPYSWHVGIQTGDIIQRCTSDVGVVHNFVQNQMLEMLRILLLVTFAYSILFPMNFAMALTSFMFLPIMFGYSFIFLRSVSERFQRADEAEGLLTSIAQENFTGVRVVRAFGRERYEVDRFDKQNNVFSDLWIKLGNLLSFFWGTGDAITGLQTVAICIVGAYQAVAGNITVGSFMVFLIYNGMTIWPVRGLGRILAEVSKTGVSLGRLKDILDAQPERDPQDAVTDPVDGDIVFERVSFSYDNQKVLDDVSFTVKKGTTLGILGSTGSGKTTIAHLLCRLYDLDDDSGKITIGGKPIESFARKWLRSNVGIVLQEPYLFSRTIGENIASLSAGYSIGDIRRAAKISSVDGSIEGFEEGYDTIVGERGVTLSGGQKQRIAIARTILKNPPIMIFDDSLSAVDTQTDANIRASLGELTAGVTTLLIAYRITSLSRADHIIVLDAGKIVEAGSHEELLAMGGVYKRVHDMQESIADLDETQSDCESLGG